MFVLMLRSDIRPFWLVFVLLLGCDTVVRSYLDPREVKNKLSPVERKRLYYLGNDKLTRSVCRNLRMMQ